MTWPNLYVPQLLAGDCVQLMSEMPESSVEAIICDPPYGIGFDMGAGWDSSLPGQEWSDQCYRVLKPGGYLAAFGATKTIHKLTNTLELSRFEIRDMLAWLYSSGMPKSRNIDKAIDQELGVEREVLGIDEDWMRVVGKSTPKGHTWQDKTFGSGLGPNAGKITEPTSPEAQKWSGWGTNLKPAFEPCIIVRKPISEGSVAKNVLRHGAGAINVDECRLPHGDEAWPFLGRADTSRPQCGAQTKTATYQIRPPAGQRRITGGHPGGRWPANVYHCKKASSAERGPDNHHPALKPLRLMRWLVRLLVPPDGTVLDTFTGSGTVLEAAILEKRRAIGCELNPEYIAIAERRIQRGIWQFKKDNAQLKLFGG